MAEPAPETTFTDADRAKFAGLVAKIWNDPELAAQYESDGRAVLAEHGIVYPQDVALPAIPERPEGDISIEELESAAAGISVSSLLCYACPVSSFSSVSN
jgi:hypothetical protein